MAQRARFPSDSYLSTRKVPGVRSGAALILNGIKYKAGHNPVRVCPVGPAVRKQ